MLHIWCTYMLQQVEKYVPYLSGTRAVLSCCSARLVHVIIPLKRNIFWPTIQSVICSNWLGLDWLFIPSLLVQKVTCAIIPDYSTGKWWWPHRVKISEKMHFLYCIFKFASDYLSYIKYLDRYWPTCAWFNLCYCNICLVCCCLSPFSKPKPTLILVTILLSECVCPQMSALISTWACCLVLRCSGSENKQSSSYLAWAGKVDSADQAAARGRGGRAQEWTLVASLPSKNGDKMDRPRAKSNALEKACSGWKKVDFFKHWLIHWIVFSCILVSHQEHCWMTVAPSDSHCRSWQHEDTGHCWNIFYVEEKGGFLSVRKPRNLQDAAAGAAIEGRCSLITMAVKKEPLWTSSAVWHSSNSSTNHKAATHLNSLNTLKLGVLLSVIGVVEMMIRWKQFEIF